MNTLANAIGAFLIVPLGIFLDKFGPKLLYLLASSSFAIGCLFVSLFLALNTKIELLFPGFIILNTAGSALFAGSFHISNTFPKYSSWLTLSFNVAFDLSAMIFSILNIVSEHSENDEARESKVLYFFAVYMVLAVLVVMYSLFLMPKMSINPTEVSFPLQSFLDPISKIKKDDTSNYVPSIESEPRLTSLPEHDLPSPSLSSSFKRGIHFSKSQCPDTEVPSERLTTRRKSGAKASATLIPTTLVIQQPIEEVQEQGSLFSVGSISGLQVPVSPTPNFPLRSQAYSLGRPERFVRPISIPQPITSQLDIAPSLKSDDGKLRWPSAISRNSSLSNFVVDAGKLTSTHFESNLPTSSSHQVTPKSREKRRNSSLILSSYVPPSIVHDYSSLSQSPPISPPSHWSDKKSDMSNPKETEPTSTPLSSVPPPISIPLSVTTTSSSDKVKPTFQVSPTKGCFPIFKCSIFKQYTSQYYVLFVWHVTITVFLINYYILTVNNQLNYIPVPDMREVLLKAWGFVLPLSGVLLSPFLGLWLAYFPYHFSFTLVSMLATMAAVLLQFHSIWVQYVTMSLIGILRPIVWTVASDYVGQVFGFTSFGRLYGALLMCIGIMNFVGYGMNVWAVVYLQSYSLPNWLLFSLQVMAYIFPFQLFRWHRNAFNHPPFSTLSNSSTKFRGKLSEPQGDPSRSCQAYNTASDIESNQTPPPKHVSQLKENINT
ncbi:hypothetical protein HMI54_015542 [Coelomomyces lativittatus]|nr:hypothetical protein HMI55_002387 [Coelomomyces lativittatus]KAJ1506644.1 hypothetical protein HMI56_000504 [Coelomomyces lativittatus]KAJ1512730.1 hypothetical protein HMI54_015542 [Coelomomyces lativittatus]